MDECKDNSGVQCSYLTVHAEDGGNVTLFTWWMTIGHDPQNDPGTTSQFVILLIVTIVAVIANILIFLVITSNKKMIKIPTNQYTAAQNINYLWIICIAPMLLAAKKAHSWTFGTAMCKAILYTFSLTTFTAIWLFVFISMDRHVHVVQSMKKKSRIAIFYPKYPVLTVLLLIVFSVLFYLPLAFYFDVFLVIDNECTNSTKCFHGNMSDQIYICAALWPSVSGALVWNSIQLTIAFVIPLIIICYNYWDIYKYVRKVSRRMRKRRTGNKVSRREIEIKVTVTCAVLVTLFVLLWTPLFVTLYSIQYARVQEKDKNGISADLFFWIFSLSLSNAMFSPLVYICMNKKFMTAWEDYRFPLMHKCSCWQKLLQQRNRSGQVDPSSSGTSPVSNSHHPTQDPNSDLARTRSSTRTSSSRKLEITVIMEAPPREQTPAERTETIELENT